MTKRQGWKGEREAHGLCAKGITVRRPRMMASGRSVNLSEGDLLLSPDGLLYKASDVYFTRENGETTHYLFPVGHEEDDSEGMFCMSKYQAIRNGWSLVSGVDSERKFLLSVRDSSGDTEVFRFPSEESRKGMIKGLKRKKGVSWMTSED